MVAEVLEEQQLESGGFLVLAVQNSGSIRQEEQDASKIYWLMWTFVNWKIEEDSFD